MSDIKVEVASVRTALAVALAEKGEDYVYVRPDMLRYDNETDEFYLAEADACAYVEPVFDDENTVVGQRPSCLWGHVLVTLGVHLEDLEKVNEDGIDSTSMPVPWLSSVISTAARLSQVAQDEGKTWGEAVYVFDQYLAERGVTP